MKITKDGYTIIYLCFFISSLFSGWKKIYMHIYQKIIKGKIIIQLQLPCHSKNCKIISMY